MVQIDCNVGKILLSIVGYMSVPFVGFGINQFQTFFHLLQSDAGTTLVGFGFRVIAVAYRTRYFIVVFRNGDADKAGFHGRDAVLECMFNQGYEYQGSYGCLTLRLDVELCLYVYPRRYADAHQFDIVAYEVNFLFQRDEHLLIVV